MKRNKHRKVTGPIILVMVITTIFLLITTQHITLASNREPSNQDDVISLSEKDLSTVTSETDLTETNGAVYLPLVMSVIACPNTDFFSQFFGEAECWVFHSAEWLVDSEHLYTEGIPNSSASTSFDNMEFSDFNFEVRLMRLGSEWNANRIFIRGNPDPLDSENYWHSYYSFQYNRQGRFAVYKQVGGETPVELQPWTFEPNILEGDNWNILRIVAAGSSLDFYINGALVWSGIDTDLTSGRVGIGMYDSFISPGDELQVDWASLTVIDP